VALSFAESTAVDTRTPPSVRVKARLL